jgi:hypothetical protein
MRDFFSHDAGVAKSTSRLAVGLVLEISFEAADHDPL